MVGIQRKQRTLTLFFFFFDTDDTNENKSLKMRKIIVVMLVPFPGISSFSSRELAFCFAFHKQGIDLLKYDKILCL